MKIESIASIMHGPHLRRYLAGTNPPLVEIEPLTFHPLYEDRHSRRYRVRRKPL